MKNRNSSWKRTFFTIWAGQAFSLLSSSIVQFAIIWHLTDTTRSPGVLALASLLAFLPQGLLGPFIGVYVDRWNRKTIMIVSDTCIAAACLVIVFFGLFSELPTWLFLVVLFIRSIGSAFHSPSLSAVTPLIVPEEQLTRCAGYSQTLASVSLLISPAIAAILYANWSLERIIFLDVLGALIGVAAVAICHIPKLETLPSGPPSVLRECLDGLRELRSHQGLFGILMVMTLFFAAYAPVNAFFPLMSMEYFGGTATTASIAEISFSAGLLIGSLILGAWGGFKRKIVSLILSVLLLGLTLVACGLLPPSGFPVFAALSSLIGFSAPFFSGVSMALFQEKIPPEYLGRVMSLSSSIMALSFPLGLGIAGLTAGSIGVNNWFTIAGIVTLFCAALCLFVPSIRNCDR